jgi:5-formyltetrahydrofolate cyclo-ligase
MGERDAGTGGTAAGQTPTGQRPAGQAPAGRYPAGPTGPAGRSPAVHDAADPNAGGRAKAPAPEGGPPEAPAGAALAKAELRRALAARRRAAAGGSPPDGVELARRVLALPELAVATWVAAFVGLPGEPSTQPLLDGLRARGVRVLLPALRGDLDLDFREYTGAVVPGALGTWEPPRGAATVDLARAGVVLVPAVAVDPHGHRLGRGGGSYDRALRRVRPDATLIAVVDDHALVDEVPLDAHDLAVSVIVTPTRVAWCR